MSTIFANIKYLLAPVLILVTFAGVLAGGIFAWLGVALLFVGIVIDTLIKKQASSECMVNQEKHLQVQNFKIW
jgi:hypothetical protein